MQATTRPRVKICCIGSLEEARLAVSYGASALGLVSAMPSGPGVIEETLIAEIAAMLPPGVSSFLLTCATDVQHIIDQQQRTRVNTIQLVDRVTANVHRELRRALPGIAIVQVVHVTGEESVAEAVEASQGVHAILLDSGNPDLKIKELGGTGRVHDWSLGCLIHEAISVPMFLAGGLNSANVSEAIRQVGPFGLDVCSGVRTSGNLDERKLNEFVGLVHNCTDSTDNAERRC
jgi:phosphoribosylanthranilate isomerase